MDNTLYDKYKPNLNKLTKDVGLLVNSGHADAVATTNRATMVFEREPIIPASPAVLDGYEPSKYYRV